MPGFIWFKPGLTHWAGQNQFNPGKMPTLVCVCVCVLEAVSHVTQPMWLDLSPVPAAHLHTISRWVNMSRICSSDSRRRSACLLSPYCSTVWNGSLETRSLDTSSSWPISTISRCISTACRPAHGTDSAQPTVINRNHSSTPHDTNCSENHTAIFTTFCGNRHRASTTTNY